MIRAVLSIGLIGLAVICFILSGLCLLIYVATRHYRVRDDAEQAWSRDVAREERRRIVARQQRRQP